MTKLLLRIFVKDCDQPASPKFFAAVGKLAGLTGIACNVLLFAIKLMAGILSGAVSIIADAMNNLTDAASSVVTLLGFRLAQRPADKDHPFGHARYEYVSGLTVAVLILVIGFELAKSALEKIFAPQPVAFTWVTLSVLLCSVAVKLWMSIFFSKLGKMIKSTTLRATSMDCRNDLIATSAVLLALIFESCFNWKIDGYMGLAVAGFILWSGVGIARETISPLLGQRAEKELVDSITQLVTSHQKVLGIHDLLVHDYGPGRCYASVHMELSAEEDPMVCHDIMDAIECEVLEKLNVRLVIHYDPVLDNDAEWTQMRCVVSQIIAQLDPSFAMHDFRIVRGASQTKLVFDLAIPYSVRTDCKLIKQQIDSALLARQLHYTTVIRFDEKE